jgi:hypothetical protein
VGLLDRFIVIQLREIGEIDVVEIAKQKVNCLLHVEEDNKSYSDIDIASFIWFFEMEKAASRPAR